MKLNFRIAAFAVLAIGGAAISSATNFSFQTFDSSWFSFGNVYVVAEPNALFASFNLQGDVSNVTALNYQFGIAPIDAVSGFAIGGGSFDDASLGHVNFSFLGSYSTTDLTQGLAISDAATTYQLPGGATLNGNISNDMFAVDGGNYEYNTLNAVPEPAPVAVLGLGALGLFARRRRN